MQFLTILGKFLFSLEYDIKTFIFAPLCIVSNVKTLRVSTKYVL